MSSYFDDRNIAFADTGISSNVGQRLSAVEPRVEAERMFPANQSDGLSDLPLPEYVDRFLGRGKVCSLLAVRPN